MLYVQFDPFQLEQGGLFRASRELPGSPALGVFFKLFQALRSIVEIFPRALESGLLGVKCGSGYCIFFTRAR